MVKEWVHYVSLCRGLWINLYSLGN